MEVSHEHLPTTNWTMRCECPEWSMEASIEETSWWKPFVESVSGSSFRCAINQFLSGLAYQLEGHNYNWWGRCSNHSQSYIVTSLTCWMAEDYLIHGVNGQISVPNPTVLINEIHVLYTGINTANNIRRKWSYAFCHIRPGKRYNLWVGYSSK